MNDNLIGDFGDLETALLGMSNLLHIQLKRNPIGEVPKFRDKLIMLSPSLESIDDKKVLLHEREFIKEFYKRKTQK